MVIGALVEGNSVRSTARMTGVGKDAILKLIPDMGAACAAFHNSAVRGVKAARVQCDEIWSFCYAKEKNVPVEKEGTGAGSVWTWTAIDADSKLIISYLCGGRDASWACQFMEDLASRVSTRIQITTDGHRVYAEAVEGAFGMEVDYAMLIKLYGSPSDNPETRYSPTTCIGIRTGILSGDPDRNHISTSYIERQNLNLRMGVRRFTRLTKRQTDVLIELRFVWPLFIFVAVRRSLRENSSSSKCNCGPKSAAWRTHNRFLFDAW
jgi:IS1 family transposase